MCKMYNDENQYLCSFIWRVTVFCLLRIYIFYRSAFLQSLWDVLTITTHDHWCLYPEGNDDNIVFFQKLHFCHAMPKVFVLLSDFLVSYICKMCLWKFNLKLIYLKNNHVFCLLPFDDDYSVIFSRSYIFANQIPKIILFTFRFSCQLDL